MHPSRAEPHLLHAARTDAESPRAGRLLASSGAMSRRSIALLTLLWACGTSEAPVRDAGPPGPARDAGPHDAGVRDAGSARDAGPPRDGGTRDAGPVDGGPGFDLVRWESTNGPTGGNTGFFVQDPVRPDHVYLSTIRGLYRSENKGTTWSMFWSGGHGDVAFASDRVVLCAGGDGIVAFDRTTGQQTQLATGSCRLAAASGTTLHVAHDSEGRTEPLRLEVADLTQSPVTFQDITPAPAVLDPLVAPYRDGSGFTRIVYPFQLATTNTGPRAVRRRGPGRLPQRRRARLPPGRRRDDVDRGVGRLRLRSGHVAGRAGSGGSGSPRGRRQADRHRSAVDVVAPGSAIWSASRRTAAATWGAGDDDHERDRWRHQRRRRRRRRHRPHGRRLLRRASDRTVARQLHAKRLSVDSRLHEGVRHR